MGKANGCACGSGCSCDCCEGCNCGCSCCGDGSCDQGFKRRYQTKAEQVAELEGYLRELKSEVQAVEERLADLKRKK